MSFNNILRIELIKLRKPVTFILLGLVLLVYLLMFFTTIKISGSGGVRGQNMVNELGIGFGAFILTLFMIINIANEFTDKTLRKSIIDGQTREDFYKGKFFLMVMVTLFVFALFVAILLLNKVLSTAAESARSQITAGLLVNSFLKLLLSPT
jgi:hypothetical protein